MLTVKILIIGILLTGCNMDKQMETKIYKKEISKEYMLNFWNAFKSADFHKIKGYYDEEVTLLPRAMLSYKSLGISPKGFSSVAKKYSKKDIFKAYHNLEKELGGEKKWKYLFSDINMKVTSDFIELSTVKDSKNKIKPYILHKTARNISNISQDDMAFVVRGERKGRDKLIFVFLFVLYFSICNKSHNSIYCCNGLDLCCCKNHSFFH